MTNSKQYIFTSERLGFRSWYDSDLAQFTSLNADSKVMQYFPSPLSPEESKHFLERLKKHMEQHGYCYFAVEELATQTFIGFIGLAYQTYESPFTPCTDVGYRLFPFAQGKGYATEGAQRCLEYAFNTLKLERVVSTTTKLNRPSESVMQKIGLTKAGEFKHPRLHDFPELEDCVWYEIVR